MMSKHRVALLVGAGAFLLACWVAAQTSERSLQHAGVMRTYRLHLPKGFTQGRSLSLVIVLHGMGGTGAITERLTHFSDIADKHGFAVAYPDGINKVWHYWGDEDPNFIKTLIDELVKQKIADPQRVYVCGISNGAYLTNVLACDWSERIAAVASVAGTMSRLKERRCEPRRAMPVLYVHGTEDPIVGYNGTDKFSKRQLSLSAEEFVQWWAKKNGCADKPTVEKLPDTAQDGTTVERSMWKGSAEVVFYKVIGGGHTWAGGSFQPERLLGKTSRDFDASEVMWEFFVRYRLPERVGQRRDAAWTRHTIDDSSRGADGVRLMDVNGDGLLDIATGWEQGGKVRVYLNPGHAKAKEKWQAVTVGEVGDPEDAVFVDLDNDGAVDVVSSCEGKTQSVFVHWAPKDKAQYLDPKAWTTEAVPAVKGKRWMFCLPMQVDGKRGVDLVIGGKDGGAQIGWLESPANPRDLADWKWHPIADVGWVMSLIDWDVDRDGDRDIITTDRKGAMRGCYWFENPAPQHAQMWKRHLIGGAEREVMFAVARPMGPKEAGLFDVLTCAKERDVILLRRETPDPHAWKEFIIPFPGSTGRAKGINVADINLDGKPDIVFSCESAGGDKSGVAWMSYRKEFTEPTWDFHDISGSEGVKFDLIELCDLDGDGDLDVITTEEVNNLGVIWYENPTKGR